MLHQKAFQEHDVEGITCVRQGLVSLQRQAHHEAHETEVSEHLGDKERRLHSLAFELVDRPLNDASEAESDQNGGD